MRFNSQRIAYWFFATCMLLLSPADRVRLHHGLRARRLRRAAPVDPVQRRTRHATTICWCVWLLSGFMGAAYFIIPEECDRELYWPGWRTCSSVALVVVGVVAIAGFHVGWWEGRKFLEIPRPLDYLVVVERAALRRQHRHDRLDGPAHLDHRAGALLRPAVGGAALPARA